MRLFVILLDDYHVRRGNDMSVRKPLIDFIQNQLAPADMVAIMYPLTPVTDLRFTRDRDAPSRAIEHFEGRKFDYAPRNKFEEQYADYPAADGRAHPQRGHDGRAQGRGGADWAGCAKGASRSSSSARGSPPCCRRSCEIRSPRCPASAIRIAATARRAAGVRHAEQTVRRQADLISTCSMVFDIANRQNTSIYSRRSARARRLRVRHQRGRRHHSRTPTGCSDAWTRCTCSPTNTDGRAIVNRNDLDVGMKQIIRDSSGYYLLGYNSTQAPTDGKFHEIKVNVKRRGIDVRARKGYWAYTPRTSRAATRRRSPRRRRRSRRRSTRLAAPARDRAARFWIGTARGENGKTRVTFSWEPVAGDAPGVASR